MPRRGRPPGLKEHRKIQRSEDQQFIHEKRSVYGGENDVIEIEDSDVSLDGAISEDQNQITRINHVPTRSGNKYVYEVEDSSDSDDSEPDSDTLQPLEELLVKVALARANIAKQKGKKNVKLKKDEMMALEKRRKILQKASLSKQRAGIYDSLTVPLSSSMFSDQMESASSSKLSESKTGAEKSILSPPALEQSPSRSDLKSRLKISKSSHSSLRSQASEKIPPTSCEKSPITPVSHSYALRSLSSHDSPRTQIKRSSETDSSQKVASPLDPFQYLVDTGLTSATSQEKNKSKNSLPENFEITYSSVKHIIPKSSTKNLVD